MNEDRLQLLDIEPLALLNRGMFESPVYANLSGYWSLVEVGWTADILEYLALIADGRMRYIEPVEGQQYSINHLLTGVVYMWKKVAIYLTIKLGYVQLYYNWRRPEYRSLTDELLVQYGQNW